jgi:AcrR family transcriptional regulator
VTTTTKRRGRPSIPKEVQRQRLIDAALRVFEKSHYEKTSVADIVHEARMSSRSFYDQFKSKEDLVAEIVEDRARKFLENLEATLSEPGTLLERIRYGMQAYFELFPVVAIDLERLGGEAGNRVREVRRHYVQLFTDFNMRGLADLYAQGAIKRLPARSTMEFLLTGIEGLSFRYYSEGRREELLALHPILLETVLRTLGDLSRPEKS